MLMGEFLHADNDRWISRSQTANAPVCAAKDKSQVFLAQRLRPTSLEVKKEGDQPMKSLKKLFMAGVFAAMAAFCLAPGLAFADEGG